MTVVDLKFCLLTSLDPRILLHHDDSDYGNYNVYDSLHQYILQAELM